MSNLKKIVLVLLSVCVLFLVLGAGLLWIFLPSNEWVRNGIETKLAEAVNTRIGIRAISVGLSLKGPITVVATDITTFGHSGQENLRISKIEMTPALLALFRGMLSISAIEMSGVKAVVTLNADGQQDYPFVPLPVSSQGPLGADSPGGNSTSHADTVQIEKKTKSQDHQPAMIWSIDSVKARDIALDVVDRRHDSEKPGLTSIAISEMTLRQDSPPNTFKVNMIGAAQTKGLDGAAKFAVQGSVGLNSGLDGMQSAQFKATVDIADLAMASAFLPDYASVLDKLNIKGATIGVDYHSGSFAKVSLSGLIGQTKSDTALLKMTSLADLSADLATVTKFETTLEASNTPVSLITQFLKNPSMNLEGGTFDGALSVNSNQGGVWVAKAALKFQDIKQSSWRWIPLSNPSIDFVVTGGSERLEIEDCKVIDQTGSLNLSGIVLKPWLDSRVLDLNVACSLKSLSNILSDLDSLNGFNVNGPVAFTGSVKGPLAKAQFELKADMSSAALDFFGSIAKPTGKKGLLWLKGVTVQTAGKGNGAPGVDATCGADFFETTVTTAGPKSVMKDVNISFKSRLDYDSQGLDIKEAELDLRRHNGPSPIAKIKGNILGITRGPLKLSAIINANIDQQLVKSLGLDNGDKLRIGGQTSVALKINEARGSYSFNLDAPLKQLDISFEESFKKKQGVDGSINLSGAYSKKATKLGSGSITLPGLLILASGTISDQKNDSVDLDINLQEADLKKLSVYFPELGGHGLSGKVRGLVTLKREKNGLEPHGSLQLESVQIRPEKSMLTFDGISGSTKVKGMNLDELSLDGRINGFVEAPIKCSGHLQDFHSMNTMKGALSVHVGKGVIRLQNFRGNLAKSQALLGALGATLLNNPSINSPEFSQISGDFRIVAGQAETNNLRQVGGDLKSGIIGSMDLRSQTLNASLGAKIMVNPPEQIGKIPAVKELVKKHEGLLKITGLDKELKRFGIDAGETKQGDPERAKLSKTPINLFFRLSGNAGSPNVTPVLENSLGEHTASKLKALTE